MSSFENLRLWPADWGPTWALLALLICFNVAVCVMSLLFAYTTGRAAALLKDPFGRLPFISWAMFWPYFLYNHLVFLAWRFLSREPAFTEVASGIYVGRRLCADESAKIAHLEPMAVVDLTAEFGEPRFMRERADYLCLPVLDMTAPQPKILRRAVEFIHIYEGQQTVYVHCALGHGRSAAVVLAWLLAEKRADSFETAYADLRAKRQGVRLTRAQQAAVRNNLSLTAG